jgi:hypothetical protein
VSSARARQYAREQAKIGGWPVGVTTYRIGDIWYCCIDATSPEVVVARGRGHSRAQALEAASSLAAGRLRELLLDG